MFMKFHGYKRNNRSDIVLNILNGEDPKVTKKFKLK